MFIVAVAIFSGVGYISAQTPPPCSSPSSCNVAAPVNVGTTGQIKNGSFGVGGASSSFFVSFFKSYLMGETWVGHDGSIISAAGFAAPGTLKVYGGTNQYGIFNGSYAKFGDVNNGKYLELGYDGAHSTIDGKHSNSGDRGLLLNYYSGGDVTIGGGAGGNSNLVVSGGVTVNTLTGTGNAYACLDANGNLFRSDVECVASTPPPTGGTTTHIMEYYRAGGSSTNTVRLDGVVCSSCDPNKFIVPAGVTQLDRIDLIGGGAGGGNGGLRDLMTVGAYSSGGAGGGGGGGGYSFSVNSPVAPNDKVSVVVGAGGSNESDGFLSQVNCTSWNCAVGSLNGATFFASGGKAGIRGSSTYVFSVGIPGGGGGNGGLGTITGNNGGSGQTGTTSSGVTNGGAGGLSGGQGLFPPTPAVTYGKGGDGGKGQNETGSPAATSGTSGNNGYVRITWTQ